MASVGTVSSVATRQLHDATEILHEVDREVPVLVAAAGDEAGRAHQIAVAEQLRFGAGRS